MHTGKDVEREVKQWKNCKVYLYSSIVVVIVVLYVFHFGHNSKLPHE